MSVSAEKARGGYAFCYLKNRYQAMEFSKYHILPVSW